MKQLVEFLSGLPLFKDFLTEEIEELIGRSHIKEACSSYHHEDGNAKSNPLLDIEEPSW